MTAQHTYFTLTAPGGHVIEGNRDRRVVEDRFARIIESDGFPDDVPYVMKRHWKADGRQGFTGEMSMVVLGCDSTGWFQLDGSKVPATASPARRLTEGGAGNRLERFVESGGDTSVLLEGLPDDPPQGKYPVLGLGTGS